MELLNAVLILALVAFAPWLGKYLHKLAPGEVAYAKGMLSWLLPALIALSVYIALAPVSVMSRLFLALLAAFAAKKSPPVIAGAIIGLACAPALAASALDSVGILILAGIAFGSLHPKGDVLAGSSAACMIAGLVAFFLV